MDISWEFGISGAGYTEWINRVENLESFRILGGREREEHDGKMQRAHYSDAEEFLKDLDMAKTPS